MVAEKTGYPAEVLELDMRLDDDLGIDSIKRVEILSAIQERYPKLPAPRPDQLASFCTLRAIAEFLDRAAGEPANLVGCSPSNVPCTGPDLMLGDHRTRSSIVASPIGPDLGDGEIARALLEAVAEKTGYPVEMLELDMRLDDDLGIDSIKRVEILSALQECFPQMPPASPEQVGTVGTLRDIVALLSPAHRTAMGDPPGTATQAAEVTHGQDPRDTSSVAHILLDAVSEKTGYPAEMLDLDMRLDDDLGIDSIKRVEILSAVQDRLPGTRSIGPEQTGTCAPFASSPSSSLPTGLRPGPRRR